MSDAKVAERDPIVTLLSCPEALSRHIAEALAAARLEGVKLGLAAAENAVVDVADERYAKFLRAIRALDPSVIAQEKPL